MSSRFFRKPAHRVGLRKNENVTSRHLGHAQRSPNGSKFHVPKPLLLVGALLVKPQTKADPIIKRIVEPPPSVTGNQHHASLFCWVGICLGLGLGLTAAGCRRLESSPPSTACPYQVTVEFEGGHLYVPVGINGTQPRPFVLDTGATETLVSQAYGKDVGLQPSQTKSLTGIGPQTITVGVAPNLLLTVAGLSWGDVGVLVTPASLDGELSQNLGRPFHGLLGPDLFKKFAVEIDYQTQRLQLFPPDRDRASPQAQVLPLRVKNNKPYIEVEVQMPNGQTETGEVLLDLGSSGGLDLWGKLFRNHPEWIRGAQLVPPQVVGVGGIQAVQVGRIPQLKIGSFTLTQPITEFAAEPNQDDSAQALRGRIGNQILQRFKVTFNYPKDQVILEPLASLSQPFETDMSGLQLAAQSPGSPLQVRVVYPNSPAARQGIQVGDRLLAINGQVSPTLAEARAQFQSGPGKSVNLRIQRDDRILTIPLTLQRLI
jgi:hypothetical protein